MVLYHYLWLMIMVEVFAKRQQREAFVTAQSIYYLHTHTDAFLLVSEKGRLFINRGPEAGELYLQSKLKMLH